MYVDLENLLQHRLSYLLEKFLLHRQEPTQYSKQASKDIFPIIILALVKFSNNPNDAQKLLNYIVSTEQEVKLAQFDDQSDDISLLNKLSISGHPAINTFIEGQKNRLVQQISIDYSLSKASADAFLALSMKLVLIILHEELTEKKPTLGQFFTFLGQQQRWVTQSISKDMLKALEVISISGVFGIIYNLSKNTHEATKKNFSLIKFIIAVIVVAIIALSIIFVPEFMRANHNSINDKQSSNQSGNNINN